MTTQLDSQIGYKKETTYGTPVTPDKFPEFTNSTAAWEPERTSGSGLRVGRIMDRADRRSLTSEVSSGSFDVEPKSKGLLQLFEGVLGTGAVTQVSGAAYQGLFTPKTSDYLPSYTIQTGTPLIGGAISPVTFAGAMFQGFHFSASNKAAPKLTFDWMAQSYSTATALATASYLTGDVPFDWPGVYCRIGGSVTVPTATALASGGTSVADVKDFSLDWSNGLDTEGFNMGGAGKRSRAQLLGKRVGTGTITAEWDATTYRDAFLADTSLPLVIGFALPTAIAGSNYPTLEFTIPCLKLEGELAKPTDDGAPITQSMNYTIYDGGVAASPLYVAIVTAETSL